MALSLDCGCQRRKPQETTGYAARLGCRIDFMWMPDTPLLAGYGRMSISI
jgi:hypothetical protein